ncbi:MBL fold metallo-hydrolase [Halovivax cerinus]|uniref:MBL fold metallo-hydrolase n=1 Tax=Halovivax cerinus TaxID=1487865 RepID=A0ABD5NNJ4_9EURY|nr:MBL fold metallo-hydrolase [Halovivax cerinus]
MIVNLAAAETAFTSNAFLVDGDRRVVVDTGANFDVVDAIESHVDAIDEVVLTHTHPDHVGALSDVTDRFDVPVRGFDVTADGVTDELADGEGIRLGDHDYVAIHTPGHKDDHLCLYAAEAGILFAGDLVFQNGGFGRTDLPEGDRATLIDSIDRLASTIDDSLRELHAGHGPSVTDDPAEHVSLAARMARRH